MRDWHFNDQEYGPYGGSIITFADGEGRSALEVNTGFDCPGIYYRYFRFRQIQYELWTLMVSLWYPLVVFGLLLGCWLFQEIRRSARMSRETHQPS
jgi:hypothetical protein